MVGVDLGGSLMISTSPVGAAISFKCEYPTVFTLESNEYVVEDVSVTGIYESTGNLAGGFSLDITSGTADKIHLLGDLLDVTATWSVNALKDVNFYFDQCGVKHDATTVNIVEGGCYSTALQVQPTPISATQISLKFKTFSVEGAQGTSQIISCNIKLCMNTCDKPTENTQCPSGYFEYTIEGYNYSR